MAIAKRRAKGGAIDAGHPAVAEFEDAGDFQVPAQALATLIERTLFAVREGKSWKLPLFQFAERGDDLGVDGAQSPQRGAPLAVLLDTAAHALDVVLQDVGQLPASSLPRDRDVEAR